MSSTPHYPSRQNYFYHVHILEGHIPASVCMMFTVCSDNLKGHFRQFVLLCHKVGELVRDR